MKTYPHNHRYWLKEHQITAFWHGFGIANALHVPKEMTSELYTNVHGQYKDKPVTGGKTYIVIDPEYMRERLKDYIKWLKSYKEAWNEDSDHDVHPKDREAFLLDEARNESRADILEMIELLQECRIDDK